MPTLNKPAAGDTDWTTEINDNWTTLENLVGATAQTIWYFNSNVASSAYASGQPYTPLAKNATEQYVTFDMVAPATGNVKLTLIYAMSVSSGDNVVLELDYLKRADGDDPNAALTTQSSYTLTPGTGTTRKSLTSVTMTTLSITVTAGDLIFFKLSRKNDVNDTHTGTFNLLAVRAGV